MKITDCKINARDLWNSMTIREKTPDEWGRQGRGIDLNYFNQEYDKTEFISIENIRENLKEHLNAFYSDYWANSYESDKCKKHITCDELDYLMDKHFGMLVEIRTLQKLESDEK